MPGPESPRQTAEPGSHARVRIVHFGTGDGLVTVLLRFLAGPPRRTGPLALITVTGRISGRSSSLGPVIYKHLRRHTSDLQ